MTCKKCGGFIDTAVKNADGSVTCPTCGTVYRRRPAAQAARKPESSSEASDTAPKIDLDKVKAASREGFEKAKTASREGLGRAKVFYEQFMEVKVGKYPAWAVVLAAVVLLGILLSVFSGGSSDPYDPVYKLEKAFNSQSAKQLWEIMDPELRKQTTYTEFRSMAEVTLAYMSGSEVKITPLSFQKGRDSNYGEVSYRMSVTLMGYPQTQTGTMQVRKVGGTWYISDLSIL